MTIIESSAKYSYVLKNTWADLNKNFVIFGYFDQPTCELKGSNSNFIIFWHLIDSVVIVEVKRVIRILLEAHLLFIFSDHVKP